MCIRDRVLLPVKAVWSLMNIDKALSLIHISLKRYASWVQNVVRQFGPYPAQAEDI